VGLVGEDCMGPLDSWMTGHLSRASTSKAGQKKGPVSCASTRANSPTAMSTASSEEPFQSHSSELHQYRKNSQPKADLRIDVESGTPKDGKGFRKKGTPTGLTLDMKQIKKAAGQKVSPVAPGSANANAAGSPNRRHNFMGMNSQKPGWSERGDASQRSPMSPPMNQGWQDGAGPLHRGQMSPSKHQQHAQQAQQQGLWLGDASQRRPASPQSGRQLPIGDASDRSPGGMSPSVQQSRRRIGASAASLQAQQGVPMHPQYGDAPLSPQYQGGQCYGAPLSPVRQHGGMDMHGMAPNSPGAGQLSPSRPRGVWGDASQRQPQAAAPLSPPTLPLQQMQQQQQPVAMALIPVTHSPTHGGRGGWSPTHGQQHQQQPIPAAFSPTRRPGPDAAGWGSPTQQQQQQANWAQQQMMGAGEWSPQRQRGDWAQQQQQPQQNMQNMQNNMQNMQCGGFVGPMSPNGAVPQAACWNGAQPIAVAVAVPQENTNFVPQMNNAQMQSPPPAEGPSPPANATDAVTAGAMQTWLSGLMTEKGPISGEVLADTLRAAAPETYED